MLKLLYIFVGGGLGSLLRYALSIWLNPPKGGFPWGTLAANFFACVVLAFVASWVAQRSGMSKELQAMVLVGFCGGFSTFSTFSLETFTLMQQGKWLMLSAYVSISLVSCLLALYIIFQLIEAKL